MQVICTTVVFNWIFVSCCHNVAFLFSLHHVTSQRYIYLIKLNFSLIPTWDVEYLFPCHRPYFILLKDFLFTLTYSNILLCFFYLPNVIFFRILFGMLWMSIVQQKWCNAPKYLPPTLVWKAPISLTCLNFFNISC